MHSLAATDEAPPQAAITMLNELSGLSQVRGVSTHSGQSECPRFPIIEQRPLFPIIGQRPSGEHSARRASIHPTVTLLWLCGGAGL